MVCVTCILADGSPNPEVKKPRVKKQCAVCRSRENLVSSGSALACIACRNFYWKVKKFIGVKQFVCSTGKGKHVIASDIHVQVIVSRESKTCIFDFHIFQITFVRSVLYC